MLSDRQVAELQKIHRNGLFPEKNDKEGLLRVQKDLDCTYAELMEVAGSLWKKNLLKRKSFGDTSSEMSGASGRPLAFDMNALRGGSTLPSPPRTNNSTPAPPFTPTRERMVSTTPTPSRPHSQLASYSPSSQLYKSRLGCPTPPIEPSEALTILQKRYHDLEKRTTATEDSLRARITDLVQELSSARTLQSSNALALDSANETIAALRTEIATKTTTTPTAEQYEELRKKGEEISLARKQLEEEKVKLRALFDKEKLKLVTTRDSEIKKIDTEKAQLRSEKEKFDKEKTQLVAMRQSQQAHWDTLRDNLEADKVKLQEVVEMVRKEKQKAVDAKAEAEKERKSLIAAREDGEKGELTTLRDELQVAVGQSSTLREELRVANEGLASARDAIEQLKKAVSQAEAAPRKRKRTTTNGAASNRPKRAYCAVSSTEENRLKTHAKLLFAPNAMAVVKPLPAKRNGRLPVASRASERIRVKRARLVASRK